MKTPLTFLLSLTFLFLFSGCGEEVKKEFYESGKLLSETHYKNGEEEGLVTYWYENGGKWWVSHYKNGVQDGVRTEWDEDGKKTFQGNFVNGNEE
jgi:antitoxin component YwqK of YwqJK toxin-antitoxin module